MGRPVEVTPTEAERAELDERTLRRRLRIIEMRIACQAVDLSVPGARRWTDDPVIARRLDEARSCRDADPARYAVLVEALGRELLGDESVDHILGHGRAAR